MSYFLSFKVYLSFSIHIQMMLRRMVLSSNSSTRSCIKRNSCTYICMYECMYELMFECMHVCVNVCMNVCMHVCMNVCMKMLLWAERSCAVVGSHSLVEVRIQYKG